MSSSAHGDDDYGDQQTYIVDAASDEDTHTPPISQDAITSSHKSRKSSAASKQDQRSRDAAEQASLLNDHFDRAARSSISTDTTTAVSWLLSREPPTSFLLEESGIPYLAARRGDHALPQVSFLSTSTYPLMWSAWVDYIFSDQDHVQLLDNVGVYYALRSSKCKTITRQKWDLRRLLLRWIKEVHTFLFAWGEATPTLEDVVAILALPMHSNISYKKALAPRNDKEAKMCQVLYDVRELSLQDDAPPGAPKRKGKRPSLKAWQDFWFKLARRSPDLDSLPIKARITPLHEVAALLVFWLSHDLFDYGVKDSVKDNIIVMSVLLVHGACLPLAPMFLGNLYRQLDILAGDLQWVNHPDHVVESHAAMAFLQVWLWEHFRNYRPSPNSLHIRHDNLHRAVNTGQSRRAFATLSYPRLALYKGLHPNRSKRLVDVMDAFEEFTFWPYLDGACGVPTYRFSSTSSDDEVTIGLNDKVDNFVWDFALAVTPGHIPGYHEGRFCALSYNIDRVARQAGFDQGVCAAPKSPFSDDDLIVARCFSRFVFADERARVVEVFPFKKTLPYAWRVMSVTREWKRSWRVQVLKMVKFCSSTRVACPIIPSPLLHASGRVKLDASIAAAEGLHPSSKGKPIDSRRRRSKPARLVEELIDEGLDAPIEPNRSRRSGRAHVASTVAQLPPIPDHASVASEYAPPPYSSPSGRTSHPSSATQGGRRGSQDRCDSNDLKRTKSSSHEVEVPRPSVSSSSRRMALMPTPVIDPDVPQFEHEIKQHELNRGGEGYVLVYGFWVASNHCSRYARIVKEYGHIPVWGPVPLGDALVSFVNGLLDIVAEMDDEDATPPSASRLGVWRALVDSAKDLGFNIEWLNDMLTGLESGVNNRRVELPQLIEKARSRVQEHETRLTALSAEQSSAAQSLARLSVSIATENNALAEANFQLRELETELKSLP